MIVEFIKGNKTKSENRILIKTEKSEAINLIELAILVNQFAVNELKIIDETENFSREKHFWYKNLMEKSIEDALKGIDWLKCDESLIKDLNKKPYFVPLKSLNKFLSERQNEN